MSPIASRLQVLPSLPPPPAVPVSPAGPARASRAAQLWLGFLFVLMSGALQRPLGGDGLEGSMTTMIVQSENRAIQIVGAGAIALTSALLVLRGRRVALPPGSHWALALSVLALFSALWSPLPGETLKRALGFAGAVPIALFAYSAFRWQEAARALFWAAALLVLGTAVLALLAPSYAFHQAGEFYGEHAGLLRGSYVHKNALARFLALALVVIVLLGPDAGARRGPIVLLAALGIGLLVLTGSAKTFVTVPMSFVAAWTLLRGRTRLARLVILAAIAYLTGLVVLSGLDDWLSAALLERLGRDTTLSGRTLIWQAAIDYTIRHGDWLAGGGYETAWRAGLGDYVQAQTSFNPGHPHNGYIAIFNQLGVIGLLVAALHLRVAFWRALAGQESGRRGGTMFPVAWLILFLANNATTTCFIEPMDLYWLLILLTPAFAAWRERDRRTPVVTPG
ncbi:MAG: O-antigen ligase family protein [Defluviimonas sp.]|uniref:O-antigen ligase family protein n=1 Tax=Albidovulum sp. TaxID=1872424 RepID=UPI001D67970E|nr:O-antigen ligase family protein [Paracoccaceae bacterium]MCC0064135.1 O-antigen ligase family protein [Defluviimonas sp.]